MCLFNKHSKSLFCFSIIINLLFHYGLFSQSSLIEEHFSNIANNIRDTISLKNSWNWPLVYSDRNLNPVFNTPGDIEPLKLLSLMEQYRLWPNGKEGEECYLVYVDNSKKDYKYLENSHKIGWINCNNLLKKERCLKTPDSLFSLKGVIVNNIYQADFLSYRSNFFYSDPELKNFIEIKKEPKRFSIFYIYKMAPKAFFLGKNERFTSEKAGKEIICGWYSSERILPLNNQIFLEPNWDSVAVAERRKLKIKPELYLYENDALNSKKGVKPNPFNIFWFNDSDKRTPSEQYPLLFEEDFGNDIFKVTVIKNEHPCFYQKVFTNYRNDSLNYPLFKYVILLSQIELQRFITTLEDLLINSFDKQETRKILVDNYITRIKMLEPASSYNDINKTLIADANRKIFGFPLMNNTIGSYKIYQINDSNAIKKTIFENFIKRTKKSYSELDKIRNNNDKFMVIQNEITYHWVSENDLP